MSVYASSLTALVSPDMQLLGQLRYHQESPPALTLLGFENVTENVVSDVDDVLSFRTKQVTHDVRRTWEYKYGIFHIIPSYQNL